MDRHERTLIVYDRETGEESFFSWDSPDIPRRGEYINFRADGIRLSETLCVWEIRHDSFWLDDASILTKTLIYAKVVD